MILRKNLKIYENQKGPIFIDCLMPWLILGKLLQINKLYDQSKWDGRAYRDS